LSDARLPGFFHSLLDLFHYFGAFLKKASTLRLHIDVSLQTATGTPSWPRLLVAEATPADIGQTGQESWHVLADPEGNEFCLLHKPASQLMIRRG
jgi:hypothetical protein